MTDQILQELNELAEAEARADNLKALQQEAVDEILTPEIIQKLDDIDAEFAGQIENVEMRTFEIRERIKKLVTEHGESVKGELRHAVFSTRTKWNGKKLEGFAMAHPEILDAKTTSTSVLIRRVK